MTIEYSDLEKKLKQCKVQWYQTKKKAKSGDYSAFRKTGWKTLYGWPQIFLFP
jgi:hypothetical protein